MIGFFVWKQTLKTAMPATILPKRRNHTMVAQSVEFE
jgi:hypothetical protein